MKSSAIRPLRGLLLALLCTVTLPGQTLALSSSFIAGNNVLFPSGDEESCNVVNASLFAPTSGINVPKDFSLGSNNKKRPVNLLIQLKQDFNFEDFHAAGIVGNFMHEASIRGPHIPPDENEGGKVGPPAFSGGYGWAQWTGGRQTAFIDFAVERGYMANKNTHATDAANYAWLVHELTKTAEKAAVSAVKQTSDESGAAKVFEAVFERAEVVANKERDDHAKDVLNAFRNGTGVGGTAGTSSVASDGCDASNVGGSVNGSVFDTVTFPLKGSKQTVLNRQSLFGGTGTKSDFHQTLPGSKYIAYDIYAKAGTQVVGFADGVITHIHNVGSLGGGVSVYNQQKKLVVYYTHMFPANSLEVGDRINPGDRLGTLVSENEFPAVNTDHLHIDASRDNVRQSCSRSTQLSEVCARTVNIGDDLRRAFDALPDGVVNV